MKLGLTNLVRKIGKVAAPVVKTVQKHAPEILTVTGCVAVVAGGTTAVVKTVKSFDDAKKDTEETMEKAENGEISKAKAIAHCVGTYAKMYGPSVLLTASGVGMIFSSNRILRKRNAQLVSAYATLDMAYRNYRKRVADEVGEEREKELYFGVEKEKRSYTEKDENGKAKKKTEELSIIDPEVLAGLSPYARIFSTKYTVEAEANSPDYNFFFCKLQQKEANRMFHRDGYLFLNDVYKLLGFKPTTEGQIVGWIKGEGDAYVDLGITTANIRNNQDTLCGYSKELVLDFNVVGPIIDRI